MKPDWKDAACYYPKCRVAVVSMGLCDTHYKRLKKYGWGDGFFRERHGQRRSPEYRVWTHIKGRCLNPSDSAYKHYGGRGISICKEWADSFDAFFSDMGRRPTEKHQIDRIDNSQGYSPQNCRWVSAAKNNQNRRSTKLTEDDVMAIRSSSETGSVIGEKYGISATHALKVKSGRSWSSLEPRP